MSNYEYIMVSAVRYALGRMTYIVELTVDYILEQIENDKLSDYCLSLIKKDIENTKNFGMECDKQKWMQLKNKIEEVI